MGASAKIAVAVVALATLLPASALAAYPGSNGKIAFERDGQIWTMNSDGTGEVQLTSASDPSTEPQWSPNGQRIVYRRTVGFEPEVRVMNADGSGDVQVRPDSGSPTWSPDGSRVGWVKSGVVGFYPYVDLADSSPEGTEPRLIRRNMELDEQYAAPMSDIEWSPRGDEIALTTEEGVPFTSDARSAIAIVTTVPYPTSTYRSITSNAGNASGPAWSPDRTQLVFLEQARDPDTGDPIGFRQIYKINADGTGRTPLTSDAVDKEQVEWSPEGTKLVFSKGDLWLMNPDGTSQTQLTTTSAIERHPDWQPVVPPPPPAAYPRPKYTGPLNFALVPAYHPCTSPNRTHGPPLAFGSCAPPLKSSANLTTGTPDRNGAPANMAGVLRLTALPGNPATTVDEGDIAVTFNLTDVRCTAPGCSQTNEIGPNDYLGELRPHLSLRITDRYNLPAPGGRLSGTTTQIPFVWRVGCAQTADTTTGSTCTSNTTVDALVGGTVIEGRRANMELGQVEVRDDWDEVFLRQGVFVP
jgi:hypothetical protein